MFRLLRRRVVRELGEQYLGFAFLVKPELQRKARQQRIVDVGAGHWFGGTLRRSKQIYASVLIGSILRISTMKSETSTA